MKNKKITLATGGLLGAAAIIALSSSASGAVVLLAAYNNLGTTNGPTNELINANSVLSGFSSTITGGQSRSNRGSNDLTYGPGGGAYPAAPGYTAGDHAMFTNTTTTDATISLTNNTGGSYIITGFAVDMASNSAGNATLGGITAGGVAVTGLGSVTYTALGSAGSNVNYDDLSWNFTVANGGAGVTLANGQTLTFSLGRSANVATSYDNIAFIGQIPEPSSTALLGLGGLALVLRRRR